MKIYDCFMFFDETMLAEIRLNILNNYVDKFIITESKYAHNGDNKKLNFDINLFSDFKKKIEYIVIDEQPPNILENNINDSHEKKEEKKIINSLKRENFQRDMLSLGLKGINDNDLVIISDVDEIPNLEKINFQENDNTIFIFKQKMFYYKFNLYYENFEWFGSRAIKKKFFLTPQWLRNIKSKKYPLWRVDTYFSKKKYHNIKFIENGGWHFTCIKSPKDVHKKLTSYLHHQDFENSNIKLIDIEKKIQAGEVLYDHNHDKTDDKRWFSKKLLLKVNSSYLPKYLDKNQNKFKQWFEK